MRRDLDTLVAHLRTRADFEYRICIDTAPLLERSYARQAGLGWIGKNTCLINQQEGSWFLLGEVLLSLELEPGTPPPDRCGTCTRCIDACPTTAIVPDGVHGGWKLDASLCISYFTIEMKGSIPEPFRPAIGNHIFGCDICQDVCPWNRRAPVTAAAEFQPRKGAYSPELETLVNLTAAEFRQYWHGSPVTRSRYSGFLRNVAVAMGNSRSEQFREPLQRLAGSEEETVREHALWALQQLDSGPASDSSRVDGAGPSE
jgi:epoxyqueuosine reductase